jgi:hypothetical protein
MQIFNPTEEMILANGWEEFVVPTPSEEDALMTEIKNKQEEIALFDSSSAVNIFYIGEQPIWMDKSTRAGLKLRFEAELALGKTDTVLWYDGIQFPLNLQIAMQMLYAIEVYASQCYDNTQQHLSNVSKLTSIDEVDSYNYHTGYPEHLKF